MTRLKKHKELEEYDEGSDTMIQSWSPALKIVYLILRSLRNPTTRGMILLISLAAIFVAYRSVELYFLARREDEALSYTKKIPKDDDIKSSLGNHYP